MSRCWISSGAVNEVTTAAFMATPSVTAQGSEGGVRAERPAL